ncbi:MAG: hypothetical protein ABL964_01270 [Steroidobacteraceae bacterium]
MSFSARFKGTESFAVLMLLFLVGYGAAAVATRTSQHVWGDDWAQYVNHARNIASDRDYNDTGYMFNRQRPNIGPPSYPPGTALLLAPVEHWAGLDIKALKLVSIGCLVLALAAVFLVHAGSVGPMAALAASLLFGLHPQVWEYIGSVLSEPPFILFSLAALIAARWRPGLAAKMGWHLASGVVVGLLAYAAFACRSIGITLLAALFLYEFAGGRLRRPWIWAVLISAAACMLLQSAMLGLADYSEELSQRSLMRVLVNVGGYWESMAFLLPLSGRLSLVTPAMVILLAGVGTYVVACRNRELQSHLAGWRSWVEAVPLEIWYLLCYVGALIVLPFAPNSRYLLPVFPIILAFAVYGGIVLANALRWQRVVTAPAVILSVAYYIVLWRHEPAIDPQGGAFCEDCQELYSTIKSRVAADKAVAFAKPRALALLTDRHSWIWSDKRSAAETWSEFAATGVSYLVTVNPSHELAPIYPSFLSWDGWRSRAGATLVFENASFRLIEIGQVDAVSNP